MMFHQPSVWLLLVLLVLPLLWWRWAGRRTRSAITFSSIEPLAASGRSWAVRLRWLVPALRSGALGLLIVCVARPQRPNERTRIFTEGVAIQLVVDRSGSMLAMDFELDHRATSRVEVVKKVVTEFVVGSDDLPGRPDDLIGLITFATFADSVCPLTLDHGHLLEAVAQSRVSDNEQDRATAIGDAVALGVERLGALADRGDVRIDRQITGRVMILLTDGESNAGDIDPITAAEMAAAFDIRIYTIGAGTDQAFAPVPAIDPFGRRTTRRVPVSIDEETLREMAERTGGRYFRATDSRSLRDIYAQIDRLERTEIEQRRYTDYEEMAVQPVSIESLRLPPLLPIVFVLLAIEITLSQTRLRTIP
ncbi:MAG: VWA domain-containing protein [Planctomycetota bacterium]|jgi:Ca-activated chloride channel family protein